MEKRRLGRTGRESTVVTFGAIPVGKKEDDQKDADQTIEIVMRRGINHFDIAPGYSLAIERVAPWMPKIREEIFLGSITSKRTRDEARESIEDCMKRLNVGSLNFFQLYGVGTVEELDKVTEPGGALKALIELREQGGTRLAGHHGARARCAEGTSRSLALVRLRHGNVSGQRRHLP